MCPDGTENNRDNGTEEKFFGASADNEITRLVKKWDALIQVKRNQDDEISEAGGPSQHLREAPATAFSWRELAPEGSRSEPRIVRSEIKIDAADTVCHTSRGGLSGRHALLACGLASSCATAAVFGLVLQFYSNSPQASAKPQAKGRDEISVVGRLHRADRGPGPASRPVLRVDGARVEAAQNSASRNPASRLATAGPVSAPTLPSGPVPVPETRPNTIAGWTVRDVVAGTAILEGPGGIWRGGHGDIVPGVGEVNSIVRWGNRWIVATSSGLISTP
jgi:hypothetical protein